MDNKNLGLLAVLGVGGYFAYTLFKKDAAGEGSGSYVPNTGGSGGSGGSGKKKLTITQIIAIMNSTLDLFTNVQLTYNQKVTAVQEVEQMINAGKSQQEIEIVMGNKYKLTPTQVRSIVDKLYK